MADVLDVSEGPVHDGDLYDGGPAGGDDLAPEDYLGWDLHVVGQLAILSARRQKCLMSKCVLTNLQVTTVCLSVFASV